MLASPLNEPIPALPAMPDDQFLVREAQSNLAAFADLYQRYANQVYRYLLVRVGNVDDAQDLTSQTFMAAMQGLKSYRDDRPFPAWLIGIARNKAADQFRRSKPDLELETEEELPGQEEQLDDLIDRQMQIEQVTRKLQVIAPDRAEALSLRLFGGLEVAEIAQIMNRNEAAVRMLVFRGLRDLQEQLAVLREAKQ